MGDITGQRRDLNAWGGLGGPSSGHPHAVPPTTTHALRLGWSLAELRGLCNPDGPRPETTTVPGTPPEALPLRSQRSADAARAACAGTTADLAKTLGLHEADQFATCVALVADARDRAAWPATRRFLFERDAQIQDELTRVDEQLANAYLLGRGLAECYWGLGPEEAWLDADGRPTACAPAFMLGRDRRRELTRMLGRLQAGEAHQLTPAAVSGSLEAWGLVVDDPDWVAVSSFRESLYEQIRRWYQLMVLRQDPTSMVRPYALLRDTHQLTRTLRVLWPQALLAVLAVGLVTWLLTTIGDGEPAWLQTVLATGSAGAVVAGGLVARARSAAQLWATRLRQDAYTDLVSADITVLPTLPRGSRRQRSRQRRALVESAVRQRGLTPATAVPDTGG